MAVDFLTSLYDEGLSDSSINSARCALSAILESPTSAYSTFGEHPDVKRLMKGIFQSRPPLPRYCKTWDVNLVLQNMIQDETAYTFMLNTNLKQSKPGKSTSELVIKLNAYPHDRNLCVVNACSL